VSGGGLDDAPPGGIDSSALEALARVRVIVSRSVITYWPHPPRSQAHRDFTAWRLIRDAFAVRERRGDPRVVPSFRYTFLPDMPSSPTPGSSDIVLSNIAMLTRSSPRTNRLDTPKNPAIRFKRGSISWLHWFAFATACRVARLPGRIKPGFLPATGDFYFQASDGLVTLPAAGYDYDIDWTPMSAGLAPAGMAASFAALARMSAPRSLGRDIRGISAFTRVGARYAGPACRHLA
jgi:hypothetical protein